MFMPLSIGTSGTAPVFHPAGQTFVLPQDARGAMTLGSSVSGLDTGVRHAALSLPTVSSGTPPSVLQVAAMGGLSADRVELPASSDAWSRFSPTFASSGSWLSNAGTDPLAAQMRAHSDAEAAALTSAQQALSHQTSMSIIGNIKST